MALTLRILKMGQKEFIEKAKIFYQQIKEDYKKELEKKWEKERQRGKYPVYKTWLSLEEIERLKKIIKKRDRKILLEHFGVVFLMLIIPKFLFKFFKFFFLPR